MKKIYYLLFVSFFLFIACEEETEDPFISTSSFTCKINGQQLSDSNPEATLITSSINPILNGALEIKGVSNLAATVMNEVVILVFNFGSINVNTPVYLSTGAGKVWQGADEYITSDPNFIGTLEFSKITANKISGTFSFSAYNSQTNTQVIVSEGNFTDILF